MVPTHSFWILCTLMMCTQEQIRFVGWQVYCWGTKIRALLWPSLQRCTQVMYKTSPFLVPVCLFFLSSIELEKVVLQSGHWLCSTIQWDRQSPHCIVMTQERRTRGERPGHVCECWWGLYNDSGNHSLASPSFLCESVKFLAPDLSVNRAAPPVLHSCTMPGWRSVILVPGKWVLEWLLNCFQLLLTCQISVLPKQRFRVF